MTSTTQPTEDFAATMRSAPLLASQVSQPASVADSGVQSGSEDSLPFAKDDVDSVKEIAGGLSSSSDEEPTPPPRTKFPIEKRPDAASPISNAASGHRSRSPRRAANRPARVRDRSCDRCAERNFGLHKKGCARAGKYKTFVTCPRCQADIPVKAQWRPHARACYKQLPADAGQPSFKWKQLVQRRMAPIELLECSMCSIWRSNNDLLRDLHTVLCAPDPKRIPSLPPLADIQRAEDEAMNFPRYFIDQIALAFTLSPTMQTTRLGYIYRYVTKQQLCLPRDTEGNAPTPRSCTGDPAVLSTAQLTPEPRPPRRPSPTAPKFRTERVRNPSTHRIRGRRSDDELPSSCDTTAPMSTTGGHLSQTESAPRGKLNYEARKRYIQPTTIIERGRTRVPAAVEMNERAVQEGLQPRWCSPGQLSNPSVSAHGSPPSPATGAAVTAAADRDRFKIQHPDGSWTDSYGRSTSPIAEAKREFKKPPYNIIGTTEAKLMFHMPAVVQVAGHLPAGWGAFVLPSPTAAYEAYVLTPGHRTPPPARLLKMDYSVKFFFAADRKVPAGTLYTDVPLHEYSKLRYRSAGVTTVMDMKPLATLTREGEGTAGC